MRGFLMLQKDVSWGSSVVGCECVFKIASASCWSADFNVSISWQLSVVTFISVPFQTVLSKWYGGLFRKLSKVTQKKLADSKTVSEAAISSMGTVKAFGAADTELEGYKYSILGRRKIIRHPILNSSTVMSPSSAKNPPSTPVPLNETTFLDWRENPMNPQMMT